MPAWILSTYILKNPFMLFCLFHMQESGSSSNQRSQSSAQPNKSGAKPGYSPSYWNPNWTEQGRFGGWGGTFCRCFVNYLPLNSARRFILCANQTLMIKTFLSALRFLYENILICNVLFTQTMSKIIWREANIFRKSSSQ